MAEATQSLRLDKWLKIARIYKSRNEATEAIEGGLVKLNGERTKPSKVVKAGDLLTIRKGSHYMEIEIKGIVAKSISSKLARELYEIKSGEEVPEEVKELVKIFDQQQKENKKEWKNTKENKKKRREISKFKYGKF
ncbi:MAG: RNA-binding S4 domain-containing protein [Brevinematia bacterium]